MDLTTHRELLQPHYYNHKRVRVHTPEGATAEEWYPMKEALLYRDRKFLRSLREKLSGKWLGHFIQDEKSQELSLHLDFENSQIKGEGQDTGGQFTVEGSYSDEHLSIQLVKRYPSYSVEFKGHYKGDRSFSGEWTQSNLTQKGFFELHKGLEHGQGLLPSPPELSHHDHSFLRSLTSDTELSGDWVGHCTQASNIYDLQLSLTFSKGKVTGSGSDAAGKFKWTGMYDAREMHLSLIKNYSTHRVYFNGFFKSNKTFEGDWVLDDDAHGFFRVTKQ